MARYRKTAIAAVALSALALTTTAAYAYDFGRTGETSTESGMSWAYSRGELTDLSPLTKDVYDGARATVVMFGINNQSTFRVSIRGLSEKAMHQHYGAHLHTGPCGLTDPKDPNTATVGPHYNTTPLIPGSTPGTTVYTEVSDETEVWLNFHVDADRDARDTAVVTFVPDPKKARSITFHASHTIRHASEGTVGSAGAKLACLPLDIKAFS